MRQSVARLMRGSDRHNSNLVKRGGSAEVSGGLISEGKSISSKVLKLMYVDVICISQLFLFVWWVSKECD